jgi:hypothetical protein
MNEERNVLVESARIARGKIQNLKEFDASYYDGILIPGGSEQLKIFPIGHIKLPMLKLIRKLRDVYWIWLRPANPLEPFVLLL